MYNSVKVVSCPTEGRPDGEGVSNKRRPLHYKKCLLLMAFLIIMPTVLSAGNQDADKSSEDASSSVLVSAVEMVSDSLVGAIELVGECVVGAVEMVGGILVSVVEVLDDSLATIQKDCASVQEAVDEVLSLDILSSLNDGDAKPPAKVPANTFAASPTVEAEDVPQRIGTETKINNESIANNEPTEDEEPIEIMSDPDRDAELLERKKDPARSAAAAKFLLDL